MHTKHLNKAIAALARLMNNSLHFVDARHLLTRAVFGQSNPLGYILAGHDPFTLDHFGSRLLGINPSLVKYLEDAEAYEVIGALPTSIPQEMKKESFKKQFHRQMYALFYWLDEMKCSMFGGRSIIPFLHWHLGIHPEINTRDSSELQRLSTLCDVGAIDTEKGEIQKDKCIKVRCLKCYREAKPGDIVLKGFGRPKNNK